MSSVPGPQVPPPAPKFNESLKGPGQPGGKRYIIPPQAPAHNWVPQDPQTMKLLGGFRL
jgi:hypothetical protein